VTETPPAEAPGRRRPASLWYERFERKRQAGGPRPDRQRLFQFLLLCAAGLLVYLGLTMRGDRLRQVMAPARPAGDWPALLSRELALDDSTGALFFPLWERWRRDRAEFARERGEALAQLKDLSAEHSDLNAGQDQLLARIRESETRELESRQVLLDGVRARLGLWRAARLRVLLEQARPAE
jgi:hypothetical protein